MSKKSHSNSKTQVEAGDLEHTASGEQPKDAEPIGSEAGESDENSDSVADLEDRLAQAEDERSEFEEKYLRAAAELQNQRKQAAVELTNVRKYAIDKFAGELLNVLESFDQAGALVESGDSDADPERLREGLELTRKQLLGALSKFSVEEIQTESGDIFDPEQHEAMMLQPTSQFEPNRVVSVIRKGYRIHDRLLRAAMVIVSAAPAAEPQSQDGPESGTGPDDA